MLRSAPGLFLPVVQWIGQQSSKLRMGVRFPPGGPKRWGFAKLVKAPDFDSGIRGFESLIPYHYLTVVQ